MIDSSVNAPRSIAVRPGETRSHRIVTVADYQLGDQSAHGRTFACPMHQLSFRDMISFGDCAPLQSYGHRLALQATPPIYCGWPIAKRMRESPALHFAMPRQSSIIFADWVRHSARRCNSPTPWLMHYENGSPRHHQSWSSPMLLAAPKEQMTPPMLPRLDHITAQDRPRLEQYLPTTRRTWRIGYTTLRPAWRPHRCTTFSRCSI